MNPFTGRRHFAWMMVWAVSLGGAAGAQAQGDIAALKLQTREFEWAAVNPEKTALGQAESWGRQLRPDGSWADVDYTDPGRSFWKTAEHMKRVCSMATLYAEERTGGHRDAGLEASTLTALRYWIRHDFRSSNWWQNDIAIPRYMATVLLLMEDKVSASDKAAALKIAARATISMTGQNRVWKTGVVFRRALVEGNLDLARQARDTILEELKVTTGEGLQADDSFQQHGPQQQMGNYGLSFAEDLASWGWIWRGTSLAMPADKLALLRGFILRGEAAVTANSVMDISACGRQLFPNSPTVKARGVITLLLAMEQVDPSNLTYRTAAWQDFQLVGCGLATGPAGRLNKDFFRSDYMVHRRPVFFASLKLCSHRVIGGEDTNAENISGRYLADGALFLYQTGKEYTDLFPVWDWRRVPGVTCVTTGTTLEPQGWMPTDFAGCVSDGTFGAAGLDLRRDGVTGKKAWFFLDTAVVCLGAGITGSTGQIRTSIDQRLADGPAITSQGPAEPGVNLHKDLAWVLNGTQGYLFAQPQDVFAGTQKQTGTWKKVYAAGSGAEVGSDVFSIWIDHAPDHGSYAYTMIPGATAEELQKETAHPSIKIEINTPEVQAVRDQVNRVTEVIFHEPGELKADQLSISVDRPCAVLIRDSHTYVSDPTQKEQEVTLTINGKAVSVKFPQAELAGSSVRVTGL